MEKQISVSLQTLDNIQAINNLLKSGVNKTPPPSPKKPTEEELKTIANELVILIAEGGAEKNKAIQTALNINQKNYSPKRDLNQLVDLTKEAYQFVNNNWDPIFASIWILRELGYLKIENNPKFQAIFKRLQKKDNQ